MPLLIFPSLLLGAPPPPANPIPSLAAALRPGRVDQKYLIYFGLASADGTKISLAPQGTYLASSTGGTINRGVNATTLHGYDISKEFTQNVYASIPHVLYGNQTDVRYDPNYNLTNPSSDLKTWVCDAKRFMTQPSDNAQFSADYNFLFQALTGSPVNVYVGTPTSKSSTPVSASTYTWDPYGGTVTFTSNQAANAVISIDGIPTAMAPEVMMRHLFLDYGQWDPAFLNLQTSNTLIPAYTGGRGSTVWQIAADIARMTAPRMVPWKIRMDEFGKVMFYEAKFATTPTEVLVDERDLFNISYNYTADNIANVWRATGTANSGQQLESIAYDVKSIKEYGQRAVQDVPSNLLYCISGMNPGDGISYLNMIAAANLWENAQPTLELTADVLPNWLRQVGDRVTIIERSNGLSGPYTIKGITKKIASGGVATQSLRLQKSLLGANFNIGLPSAVTNAVLNNSATPPTVNSTTNIFQNVTINGVTVVDTGDIARNYNGDPVIPIVSPTETWTFGCSLFPNQNYDTVLFHYIYAESKNSLSSTDLMAIQGTGFGDGTIIPAATVAAGHTSISTHAYGSIIGGSEHAYIYGNIVLNANPSLIPCTYAVLTSTPAAAPYLGPNWTYGVAYGSQFSSGAWYLSGKQTVAYLVLMAANANGAVNILRLPFYISL